MRPSTTPARIVANVLIVILGVVNLTWLCDMPAFVYLLPPLCCGLGLLLWIYPARTAETVAGKTVVLLPIGLNVLLLIWGTYAAWGEYQESLRSPCVARSQQTGQSTLK